MMTQVTLLPTPRMQFEKLILQYKKIRKETDLQKIYCHENVYCGINSRKVS